MTRADAAKLVAIVVTAYPNFDKFRDAQAIASTVDLWAAMFMNDDNRIVWLAAKKHIATSKWPPSVAELREIMLEIQRPDLIAPDQAWAAVSDYMHTAGQHGSVHPERALPPLVARAVEVIGYNNLYEMNRGSYGDSKPGMARVAFMAQYTAMYEREGKSNDTDRDHANDRRNRRSTPGQGTEPSRNERASSPEKRPGAGRDPEQ